MTATASAAQTASNAGGTPQVKETKGALTRTYKVLRVEDPKATGGYTLVGAFVAANDKSAIRQAVEEHGPGRYAAVSLSAWHEHSLEPKVVERLSWS